LSVVGRRLVALSILAAGALLALASAGCAHVQPWEKEHMALLADHEARGATAAAYDAHFWSVREASAGGTGQAGGGCGCN